jgi:8-hydroxy-5-deazaflavin:NADPH oxidoreductase
VVVPHPHLQTKQGNFPFFRHFIPQPHYIVYTTTVIACYGLSTRKGASNENQHYRIRKHGNLIATTHYGTQVTALKSLGNLAGKVVIDISNPLKADMSGLQIGHSTSASEEVAKQVPNATVIKAFNTVFAQVLQEGPKFKNGMTQVFYAGDDESAKTKVKSLIESLGFEATDAGPLANSRYLEPMGMLNIWFGYMAQKGTGIAPTWASRN